MCQLLTTALSRPCYRAARARTIFVCRWQACSPFPQSLCLVLLSRSSPWLCEWWWQCRWRGAVHQHGNSNGAASGCTSCSVPAQPRERTMRRDLDICPHQASWCCPSYDLLNYCPQPLRRKQPHAQESAGRVGTQCRGCLRNHPVTAAVCSCARGPTLEIQYWSPILIGRDWLPGTDWTNSTTSARAPAATHPPDSAAACCLWIEAAWATRKRATMLSNLSTRGWCPPSSATRSCTQTSWRRKEGKRGRGEEGKGRLSQSALVLLLQPRLLRLCVGDGATEDSASAAAAKTTRTVRESALVGVYAVYVRACPNVCCCLFVCLLNCRPYVRKLKVRALGFPNFNWKFVYSKFWMHIHKTQDVSNGFIM